MRWQVLPCTPSCAHVFAQTFLALPFVIATFLIRFVEVSPSESLQTLPAPRPPQGAVRVAQAGLCLAPGFPAKLPLRPVMANTVLFLRPAFIRIKIRKGVASQQAGKKIFKNACAHLRARPCLQEPQHCPALPITSHQIYYRNCQGAALLHNNKIFPETEAEIATSWLIA